MGDELQLLLSGEQRSRRAAASVNSTRSGGKSQISDVRRVIPRSVRLIGKLWPLGSVSVPAIAVVDCRGCG